MTIGLAGVCRHEGRHAIVMCADSQGTHGFKVKTRDLYKIRFAGQFAITFAGDASCAKEAIMRLSPALKRYDDLEKTEETDFDIRLQTLLKEVRQIVQALKRERIEHLMMSRYGVTYKEWKEGGKNDFPSEIYYRILNEISNTGIGCDLICCYARDTEPVIIEITDHESRVKVADDYCCIGSGGWFALAIMYQNPYSSDLDLLSCISQLTFAKKAAEADPHVNEKTGYVVLLPTGNAPVTTDLRTFLGKNIKKMKAPTDLKFDKPLLITDYLLEERSEDASVENIPDLNESTQENSG